jgi:hypothetical protein
MQTMYLQVKKQMVSAVFHVVLAYYISLSFAYSFLFACCMLCIVVLLNCVC